MHSMRPSESQTLRNGATTALTPNIKDGSTHHSHSDDLASFYTKRNPPKAGCPTSTRTYYNSSNVNITNGKGEIHGITSSVNTASDAFLFSDGTYDNISDVPSSFASTTLTPCDNHIHEYMGYERIPKNEIRSPSINANASLAPPSVRHYLDALQKQTEKESFNIQYTNMPIVNTKTRVCADDNKECMINPLSPKPYANIISEVSLQEGQKNKTIVTDCIDTEIEKEKFNEDKEETQPSSIKYNFSLSNTSTSQSSKIADESDPNINAKREELRGRLKTLQARMELQHQSTEGKGEKIEEYIEICDEYKNLATPSSKDRDIRNYMKNIDRSRSPGVTSTTPTGTHTTNNMRVTFPALEKEDEMVKTPPPSKGATRDMFEGVMGNKKMSNRNITMRDSVYQGGNDRHGNVDYDSFDMNTPSPYEPKRTMNINDSYRPRREEERVIKRQYRTCSADSWISSYKDALSQRGLRERNPYEASQLIRTRTGLFISSPKRRGDSTRLSLNEGRGNGSDRVSSYKQESIGKSRKYSLQQQPHVLPQGEPILCQRKQDVKTRTKKEGTHRHCEVELDSKHYISHSNTSSSEDLMEEINMDSEDECTGSKIEKVQLPAKTHDANKKSMVNRFGSSPSSSQSSLKGSNGNDCRHGSQMKNGKNMRSEKYDLLNCTEDKDENYVSYETLLENEIQKQITNVINSNMKLFNAQIENISDQVIGKFATSCGGIIDDSKTEIQNCILTSTKSVDSALQETSSDLQKWLQNSVAVEEAKRIRNDIAVHTEKAKGTIDAAVQSAVYDAMEEHLLHQGQMFSLGNDVSMNEANKAIVMVEELTAKMDLMEKNHASDQMMMKKYVEVLEAKVCGLEDALLNSSRREVSPLTSDEGVMDPDNVVEVTQEKQTPIDAHNTSVYNELLPEQQRQGAVLCGLMRILAMDPEVVEIVGRAMVLEKQNEALHSYIKRDQNLIQNKSSFCYEDQDVIDYFNSLPWVGDLRTKGRKCHPSYKTPSSYSAVHDSQNNIIASQSVMNRIKGPGGFSPGQRLIMTKQFEIDKFRYMDGGLDSGNLSTASEYTSNSASVLSTQVHAKVVEEVQQIKNENSAECVSLEVSSDDKNSTTFSMEDLNNELKNHIADLTPTTPMTSIPKTAALTPVEVTDNNQILTPNKQTDSVFTTKKEESASTAMQPSEGIDVLQLVSQIGSLREILEKNANNDTRDAVDAPMSEFPKKSFRRFPNDSHHPPLPRYLPSSNVVMCGRGVSPLPHNRELSLV